MLVILAENGRLRFLESIAKKFTELTMAHKGEVKAIVTSVIVSLLLLYYYFLFLFFLNYSKD